MNALQLGEIVPQSCQRPVIGGESTTSMIGGAEQPGLDNRPAYQGAEEMPQFDASNGPPCISAITLRCCGSDSPQALIGVTLGNTTHFNHCDHSNFLDLRA